MQQTLHFTRCTLVVIASYSTHISSKSGMCLHRNIHEDLSCLINQVILATVASVSNELFVVENVFQNRGTRLYFNIFPPFLKEMFTLFSVPPTDEGSCNWDALFVVIVVVIIHFT